MAALLKVLSGEPPMVGCTDKSFGDELRQIMKSKPTPIFVPPLKAKAQGGTTVRIASRQTEGAYCVCEMTTMPGDGVSLHVHDRDEEFLLHYRRSLRAAGGR